MATGYQLGGSDISTVYLAGTASVTTNYQVSSSDLKNFLAGSNGQWDRNADTALYLVNGTHMSSVFASISFTSITNSSNTSGIGGSHGSNLTTSPAVTIQGMLTNQGSLTYLWTHISGESSSLLYVNSATATTTTWGYTANTLVAGQYSAVWQCVITDSLSNSINGPSVTVSLNLT